jgi:hypothetical protein
MNELRTSLFVIPFIGFLAFFCVPCHSHAAEVVVQKPVLALSGYYEENDGRVANHHFPIELKLYSDGTCKGELETWMEVRMANGPGSFGYSKVPIAAKLQMDKGTIVITFDSAAHTLRMIKFKDMQLTGLSIKFAYKTPKSAPNMPSGDDG